MENIEKFLKGSRAYGVPDNGLFACVDLYEGRNMPMVLSTILQVGSEVCCVEFVHLPTQFELLPLALFSLRLGHLHIFLAYRHDILLIYLS